MLSTASITPADQPQMRYDAATNTYQLRFAGGGWNTLWTKVEGSDQAALGDITAVIGFDLYPEATRSSYPYSALAWYAGPGQQFGTLAVGVPTPEAAVPTSGSARYDGIISGETDIFEEDLTNGPFPYPDALGVTGTVTLSFDFSGGTLSGSMEPKIGSESLGVFTFKNGVYSAGAYSGQFNTSVNGLNGFYGQLTGPNGQELIGGWALPFHYSGDGQDHEAMGAWVAKQ